MCISVQRILISASRAGIAPYMAIELAVFDLIPRRHLPFARGFTAAFLATTACYPLDTVRCSPCLMSLAALCAAAAQALPFAWQSARASC